MRLEPFRKSPAPLALVGEGILAGLAGTAVMTAAQLGIGPRIPQGPEPKRKPRWPSEPEAKGENATQTAARRFVQGVARRQLRRKNAAGYALHFAVGAASGALLALLRRRPTLAEGLLFGTAIWIAVDNALVPLLRLGDLPDRYPPGAHAAALLAHLAYGAGTALALTAVDRKVSR